MILHIPHASSYIPDDVRETLLLDNTDLAQELLQMTDAFTHELFRSAASVGEDTLVLYPVSRLVVDPQRVLDDNAEPMAGVGMGAIYTRTSDGRPLRAAVSAAERENMIRSYYLPHHQRLENAVDSELKQYGLSLIIDGHSYPSVPLPYEQDASPQRPDICIGTDPHHTPPALAERMAGGFRTFGLSVALNRPRAGSMVPAKFFGRNADVFSIRLEVKRSLYMDEKSGRKHSGFSALQSLMADVLGCFRFRNFRPFDEMAESAFERI